MSSIQFKKSKAGKKTYYVVVSANGRHKWLKGGTLAEAKRLKKHIDSLEVSDRIEQLSLRKTEKRIDDFFQEFADHSRLHNAPGTTRRYLRVINTLLCYLRMYHPRLRYLSQIRREHMEDYQRCRLESYDLKREADGDKRGTHKNKRLPLPQTVNYELNVLRSAFMWAEDRDLISRIPTAKIRKLKPNKINRPKILSEEECKKLLETAEQLARSNKRMVVYYRAVKFLLNTGLRSGELCNLTWDDIDLDTGLIKIQAKADWSPKTYAREFFMNDVCVSLLRAFDSKEGYVFTSVHGARLDPDRLRRGLLQITKKAGLEDFTRVHDLRHTFNSLMQMNGVDPGTMGKILGHKDIETTMIYTHQTAEHLKKSIGKIEI